MIFFMLLFFCFFTNTQMFFINFLGLFPNCDLNVHLYVHLYVLTFDENDDLCDHVHDDQNLSHDRIGDHVPNACDHDKNSFVIVLLSLYGLFNFHHFVMAFLNIS